MSSMDAIIIKLQNGELTVQEAAQMIRNLKKQQPVQKTVQSSYVPSHGDIAVIGMSGRFPGADNIEMFWKKLMDGTDRVQEIPAERWNVDKYYDPDPAVPGKTYCKWGGMLSDVDKFDPMFFNLRHGRQN